MDCACICTTHKEGKQPHAAMRFKLITILGLVLSRSMSAMGAATSCFDGAGAAPVVNRFASSKELGDALAKRLIDMSKHAIETHGEFIVALSGGSLPNTIAPGLLANKDNIDWKNWKVYFADERHVSYDHSDSNYKGAMDAFLNQVSPAPKIIGINSAVSVEEAAIEYERQLPENKRFDLILLGMGPDGHTASLFPGHALLEDKSRKIAFIKDSPKPPPQRITFTLPYINDAKNVFFVTTGASKADVVARCAIPSDKLEKDPLPSARVRPTNGALEWFLDADAAAKL